MVPDSMPLIDRDEFRRMESLAAPGVRFERMDGYVYAMAGAGLAHERVVSRAIALLHGPTRAHGCEVLGSNRRLSIGENSDFLPDLAVYCDPVDIDEYAGTRPCLVIEVLSRSTAMDDLNLKLPRYKQIPSLEAILFVNPDPLYVELYTRSTDGWQREHITSLDEAIVLPCPPMSFTLAQLA